MKAYFTKIFKKHYFKRIQPFPSLDKRFEEKRNLFVDDPRNPILDNHPLKGKMKGFREFQ